MGREFSLEEKLKRWHLRLAVGYAVVGVTYILVSDRLVHALIPNPQSSLFFEMAKGTCYVVITAFLLYGVLSAIRTQVVKLYEARNRALRENQALTQNLELRVQERTGDLEFVIGELESFSYSVSHDLRRPLRAIDAIRSELAAKSLDPQTSQQVDELARQVKTMSDIIEDLLSLSRVGREGLRRETVDVTALSKRIFADLARRESERSVHVEVQPGMQVIGDESMLNLALMNLIHNAWKYIGSSPDAKISVRMIDHDLIVEDNGIGIDPGKTSDIFKPFSRLPGAESFTGTGIGLAIVERIVRRHGGTIRAENASEGGAKFIVTLPPATGTETSHASV